MGVKEDTGMNGVTRRWWCHLLWLRVIENRKKVSGRRQVALKLLPWNMWFSALGTRPENESLLFNKSLLACFSCRCDESWIKMCSEVKLEWHMLQRFSFWAFEKEQQSENVDFSWLGEKEEGEMKAGFRQVQGSVHLSLLCYFFIPPSATLPPSSVLILRVEAKDAAEPLRALCPKLMHFP